MTSKPKNQMMYTYGDDNDGICNRPRSFKLAGIGDNVGSFFQRNPSRSIVSKSNRELGAILRGERGGNIILDVQEQKHRSTQVGNEVVNEVADVTCPVLDARDLGCLLVTVLRQKPTTR